MSDRTTSDCEAAIARFREHYIEIIQNQGVTKPFERWYVIWAQGYIDARPGLRRKGHRIANLTDYFNAPGR
jgi:hypothetical protein